MAEMTSFVVGGTVHMVPPLTIWSWRNGGWDVLSSLGEAGDVFIQSDRIYRLMAIGLCQNASPPPASKTELEAMCGNMIELFERTGSIGDFRELDKSLKLLLERSGMGAAPEGESARGSRSVAPQESGMTSLQSSSAVASAGETGIAQSG